MLLHQIVFSNKMFLHETWIWNETAGTWCDLEATFALCKITRRMPFLQSDINQATEVLPTYATQPTNSRCAQIVIIIPRLQKTWQHCAKQIESLSYSTQRSLRRTANSSVGSSPSFSATTRASEREVAKELSAAGLHRSHPGL